jgi:hypothetical protein
MKVLVFAPHAGIWVHAFPEALIAKSLQQSGMDIVYVTCDGALSSFCVAMGARGLSPASSYDERAAACRDCRSNRDRLRSGFELAGYHFESVLDADERRAIDLLVARMRPRDVLGFEVDGIAVGRAALYEYLIQNKRSQFAVSDEEWPRFRLRLITALRSLRAAQTILDRERPDRIVAYNTLYSVNAMWRAAAKQRGVLTYFMHAGMNLGHRLQTMMIGIDSPFAWFAHAKNVWRETRDLPCSASELAAVTDHYERLFRGASVFAYSAAKATQTEDIRGRFNIRADQRVLVATMSSYDEYAAAAAIDEMPAETTTLFATQRDWLRALIPWVAQRPDLFLIIRVHPREFPNKRDGAKSEHAMELERELVALPPNVRVNWPTDNLSIYDIAQHTDVALNAWSSVGREMPLLGIPVVIYSGQLILYPSDLNYLGETEPAYFAAIERALRDGWSFERIRRAYRWNVLELVRGGADLSDGFDFDEAPPASAIERVWRLALSAPGVRQRWDLWRRSARLRVSVDLARTVRDGAPIFVAPPSVTTEHDETAALRAELRRIVRALYAGDNTVASPLRAHLEAAAR